MPLTDLSVRNAAPKGSQYKVSDSGGLYLLVRPDGARYWRMDYRLSGRRGTLAFGVYPDVSLADAREKREIAKKQLAAGIDPAVQRKLDKIAAAETRKHTFRVVADEWIEKLAREGKAPATLEKIKWLIGLACLVSATAPSRKSPLPSFFMRSAGLRRAADMRRRGAYAAPAVRCFVMPFRRAALCAIPRPTSAARSRHRRSSIEQPSSNPRRSERCCGHDGYDGYPVVTAALRLAPLVFVRPGELRNAEWTELDLDAAEWRIPASKMKMRLPHRVPLARQTIAVLHGLHPLTGAGRYLFPSIRSVARPISENTLNAALRRLGYAKDEATTHGFRATAAVRLNEMGKWNPDAIERQLAHQEANAVRRAYTHAAEYWDERCEMMQAWAD